jgi:CMP-N-acetylneuraminic acid synthetase
MTPSNSSGPNIVAFIFARGGSKGMPRKNLRVLGGVYLLARAWRHAVDFIENQPGARPIDIFVSVPTVCPLRNEHDVARALALYRKGNCDIVFSVTPSKPYDSRVKLDSSGAASLAQAPDDAARQRVSTAYDVVDAVYVTSPAFIRQSESIWGGRNATIEIPRERAVDIDTEMDFRLAEFLLQGSQP